MKTRFFFIIFIATLLVLVSRMNFTTRGEQECKAGEMFLGNISTRLCTKIINPEREPELMVSEEKDFGSSLSDYESPQIIFVRTDSALQINFDKLIYQTKRLGNIAYDENGIEEADMKPVYIKIWEYQKYNPKSKK